jgi:hypothetical protein
VRTRTQSVAELGVFISPVNCRQVMSAVEAGLSRSDGAPVPAQISPVGGGKQGELAAVQAQVYHDDEHRR